MTRKRRSLSNRGFINRENIEALVIAVILALFIRTFIVQAFKIPSGSMEPTLLIGDHLLVNKFIYGITIPFTDKKIFEFKKPKQNDVIVFKYPLEPKKDFIKRVIGTEGDKILIKNKKIFINGKIYGNNKGVYIDKNLVRGPRDNLGPVIVPRNCLFVMGDNRDNSHDSRFWGFVDVNKVKGKAFIIYWSWGSFLKNIKWKRIGNIIN
jgi:signal peptidase I